MWIILSISAAFFNAGWTSLTAKKDKNLSSMEFTIIFRFLTAIILLPFFIIFSRTILTPNVFLYSFLYSIVEGIRTFFIVKGSQTGYYSTYAFVNMSPVFTILFSFMVPDEPLTAAIVIGTFITVLGGIMFYKIGKFSLAGLIVAVLGGFGVIVSKLGVTYSDGITFSFTAFVMLVIIFTVIDFSNTHRLIVLESFQYLKTTIIPALLSALASICYFTSLETGKAVEVANIMRTNLIFGFLFSYFFLKEVKDIKFKIFGGFLIIIGGLVVSSGEYIFLSLK